MSHISGSMEESDAGSNVGNDGPVQDAAEDTTSKWPKEHPCDILAFSLGPKNLSEAKLKSFG